MKDLEKIRSLVGDITEEDLKYVDVAVCDDLGVFVPSVGFCGYAVQKDHTHPSYSFTILPERNSNVVAADISHGEGQYIAAMMPPGVPHEETPGDEFVRYFAVMVSRELMDAVRKRYGVSEPDEPHWKGFPISKRIMALVTRFMDEYESEPPDDTVLRAIACLIVNDLVRGLYHVGETGVTQGGGLVRNAVDYVQQNFEKHIAVAGIAAHLNLSESAFSRKFKRETGKSPAAYLLWVRLQKAKKLMRSTEASVTDIAHRCGFGSAAHLSASFKKAFRMTPTEYRSFRSDL